MNRNLVTFGVFLVVLGVGFGFYLLAFLGLLLLIPAFLSSGRPPVTRPPAPPRQEPRRIIPPTPPRHPAPEPQPRAMEAPSPPAQPQTYPSALFPMPMFPSLSQMGTAVQRAPEPVPKTQEGGDMLLETAAMLALMKLLMG